MQPLQITGQLINSVGVALRRSRLAQIAVLGGFWYLGDAVARTTGLPVPGGVLGMIAVLVLLATRRVQADSLRRGGNWLLADILLFFIPAVMAVLDHQEFIGVLGLKLLAVIVVGTVMVMGGTALAVDLCWRWQARHAMRHAQ